MSKTQIWYPGDKIEYYLDKSWNRRDGIIQYRSLVNQDEVEYIVKTRHGKFEVVNQDRIVSGTRLLNQYKKCECGSENPNDPHSHSWYCPRRVDGVMS